MSVLKKISRWLDEDPAPGATSTVGSPPLATPVPPSGGAKDALARLLRTLGERPVMPMEDGQAPGWLHWAGAMGEAGVEPAWETFSASAVRERRREVEAVATSLGGLRETLWSLVNRITRSLSAETGDDGRIEAQMERLRYSVHHASIEQLRTDVLGAIESIGTVLREREERQRRELEAASRQLGILRGDLERLRLEAELDGLTRIANRASFERQLEAVVTLSTFGGEIAVLAMFDLDHFKQVNDRYGHLAGDEALRAAAASLQTSFLRRTDFVARFGGEEFAILLPDTNEEQGVLLVDRALAALRRREIRLEGGRTISVTASVGVAAHLSGESGTDWVGRVDQALYEAKRQGRDRAVRAKVDRTSSQRSA